MSDRLLRFQLYIVASLMLLSFLGCAATPAPVTVGGASPVEVEKSEASPQSAEQLWVILEEDRSSLPKRLALLDALDREGNVDMSLRVIDEGLEIHPQSAVLHRYNFKVLWSLGYEKEATKALTNSALSGGDAQTHLMSIKLLTNNNMNEEALKVAKHWVESEPENAEAHFAMARLLAEMGENEKGLAAYHEVLKHNPEHIQALSVLAVYYQSRGENDRALEYLRPLVKKNPHAELQRVMLAEILYGKGDEKGALAELVEGEKYAKNSDVLYRMASLASTLGDFDLSLRLIDKLVLVAPEPGYWYLLGTMREQYGDHEGAVAAHLEVAEGEFYPLAQAGLAISYSALGKEKEVDGIIEKFKEASPASAEAVHQLATHISRGGRNKDAALVMEAYEKLHGEPESPKFAFSLGVIYDSLGRWEESLKQMERVLGMHENEPYALNYIAYTYAIHDLDLVRAEKLVRKALEFLPDAGPFIDTLGWVLYKMGRYEEALTELLKAGELLPDDPVVHEHIGDAALKVGKKGRALEAYEKALALDKDNEELKAKVKEVK